MTDTEHLGEAAAILTGQAPAEEPETDEPAETEHNTDEGLLATEGDPVESPQAEPDAPEMPQTYSVKELAERLDVRPQDVYAGLTIDVAGEKLPIGEFKDRAKDLKRADQVLADAKDAKAEFERDYLVKSQILNQRESGKQLSEQEIKAFEDQRGAAMQLEAQKLVQARPELADPETNTKASQRVTELLADYGVAPYESEQLYDARLTLAFLRLADLEDRLTAAKESVATTKRKQKPKSIKKDGSSAGGIVGKVKSGSMTQQEGVAALLTGG